MLKRKATYFTPDLFLNDNELIITGNLWMEDAQKYFEKIHVYTSKSNSTKFRVVLNVEHLNSSSIKQLLLYFKLLKSLLENNKFKKVEVLWNVEDDDKDLLSLVDDLEQISEIKIELGRLILNNKINL